MEGVSVSSSKSIVLPRANSSRVRRQLMPPLCLPAPAALGCTAYRRVRFRVSAHRDTNAEGPSRRLSQNAGVKQNFASISTSKDTETSSIGTPQFPTPAPKISISSPLIWVGVGVGLSALFSWVSTNLKKYVMQRAMNTFMEQMASGSGDQNPGFSPGPRYPFPSTTFPPTASRPVPDASRPVPTIDVPSVEVETATDTEVTNDADKTNEAPKRYAFVDVSPEDISLKDASTSSTTPGKDRSTEDIDSASQVSSNGSAAKQKQSFSEEQQQSRKSASFFSVDVLERMMEDPTVQKMLYSHLPEEMRNPETIKWMLQNPQYRQQLQDMLDNMGGSGDWDSRITESLKNFDLSSPEVKQQFDQIGLTPEQVISKIMADPGLAMAFQNPKVQAAIMDCSQNPFNIGKYQDDKEVMDVFNKISELFPGVTGP